MNTELTIAQRLAQFATARPTEADAQKLHEDARRRVRDFIGNSLAACDSTPAAVIANLLQSAGGNPQASLIGRQGRHPAALAALFNGTLAHALDFDDTHLPSVLHPSASVIAAALAAAEASGGDMLKLEHAVAVGNEICIRLGMAGYNPRTRDSVYFAKGLHATSICGTIGAAAAAGLLFDLDEGQITDALAIATSMGAGLIEANRTGGSVKRIHCGWAAHAGVTAAEMARAGLTGPPTAFEGRFGFLQAYLDEAAEVDAITSGLGTHWEVLGVFYKPYPSNHFTQAGIDAALELRRRGILPGDLAAVELAVPHNVLRTIAEPAAEKAQPPNGYTAKFSGPFTFATALVGGGGLGVYLDDFADEKVDDPARLAVAKLVHCVGDHECDEIFPFQFPAIARVRTKSGSELEIKVLANRGGPANPLSHEDLRQKFLLNAQQTLSGERVCALDDALERAGATTTVTEILALAHE